LNYQHSFIKYFYNNELLLETIYANIIWISIWQWLKKDDFFDFNEPENSPLIPVNKDTMDCLRFLEEPCDESLEVLHQFPSVKYLFRKLNATVPSSAPVERLFSSGSLISTPRRNRLIDKRFEQLLLLKANNAV